MKSENNEFDKNFLWFDWIFDISFLEYLFSSVLPLNKNTDYRFQPAHKNHWKMEAKKNLKQHSYDFYIIYKSEKHYKFKSFMAQQGVFLFLKFFCHNFRYLHISPVFKCYSIPSFFLFQLWIQQNIFFFHQWVNICCSSMGITYWIFQFHFKRSLFSVFSWVDEISNIACSKVEFQKNLYMEFEMDFFF